MKLIVAIVQPPKLKAVTEGLVKIGVSRFSVCDAQGYARQKGQLPTYRGREYQTQFLRKAVLEIVVNDDFVERTIGLINSVARTGPDGSIGDGKIWTLPVDDVIQIGDDQRGPQAV